MNQGIRTTRERPSRFVAPGSPTRARSVASPMTASSVTGGDVFENLTRERDDAKAKAAALEEENAILRAELGIQGRAL